MFHASLGDPMYYYGCLEAIMNDDLTSSVVRAFEQLFELPVIGEVTHRVWEALELSIVGSALLGTIVEKAALTAGDGQLHSAMFVLPVNRPYAVCVMTWPGSLRNCSEKAKDQFYESMNRLPKGYSVTGVAQFDLFPRSGGAARSPACLDAPSDGHGRIA
jgi:hypothetical protein